MALSVKSLGAAEVLGQGAGTPPNKDIGSGEQGNTALIVRPRGDVVGPVPSPVAEVAGELALLSVSSRSPGMSREDLLENDRRARIVKAALNPGASPDLWRAAGQKNGRFLKLLAEKEGVAWAVLYRWLRCYRKSGGQDKSLGPMARSDAGRPRIVTPAARAFIGGCALPKAGEHGLLSMAEIERRYAEELSWRLANRGRVLGPVDAANYAPWLDSAGCLRADAMLPPINYRTLLRVFNGITPGARVLAREGLEAFKNSQEIISWRAIGEMHVMQCVVFDNRLIDQFVLAPYRGGWRVVRPWIVCAVDMRSRKWLAWALVEVPSSTSIASVFRRVISEFGLPAGVLWDNGRDYKCRFFEGGEWRVNIIPRIESLGERADGVIARLGIRSQHALPYNARAKLIEPAFLATANFDRTQPNWTGHRPDARPDERLKALFAQHALWEQGKIPNSPFPTLATVARRNDEMFRVFNDRPHTGNGMSKIVPAGTAWMSPNECFREFAGPKVVVDDTVLALCFQRRKMLKVRHGEVKATFGGQPVHYRMLDNPNRLMDFNGLDAEFGYDEFDLSTGSLFIGGKFVGLVDAVSLRAMGGTTGDFVEDERARRASRRDVRKAIALLHAGVHVPSADERASRRAPVVPEVARPEVAAVMQPAMLAAAAAKKERAAFRFGDDVPSIVAVDRGGDDSGTEFHFFSEEKK